MRFVSAIDTKHGDRILDIGCGTGDILKSLPHFEYVGSDTNEMYILQSKDALRNGDNLFARKWRSTNLAESLRSISF